ncbi:galactokinase family protein [Blastococcus brunescens]|uniref:Galactokinase family protein n=1 Tax=Blastococcus brunescens TaxID=1564165 RepID=A0ABZ1AVL3_9ACTN|nr:galactokinase family protein [Blastococcus sp. BMG 8361]WRL62604.1 galactokinase family protein [Blastococcus sp. BMG 8361]
MTDDDQAAVRAAEAFRERYGRDPEGVWAAPGRVNVIGEHTDYNDGYVLPVALPHTTRAAVGRRTDGRLALASLQGDGAVVELAMDELAPAVPTAGPATPQAWWRASGTGSAAAWTSWSTPTSRSAPGCRRRRR